MAASETRPALPLVLSFNAGYVDAAGFLALQGLFTSHVTGNFVTLGASLALGTSGAVAKLLALPVFCAVVIASRLFGTLLSNRSIRAFETLLGLKVLFLAGGAALALRLGPFQDGDSWQAILTGMVLVAAMAIQNAVHRVHLASAPPSTVMTVTTTQIMLDLADRIYPPARESAQSGSRLVRMSVSMLVFATGCGTAALLYARFGVWCLVVPPIPAIIALFILLREQSSASS
jgi:uncharacterized membrane protein YoaK (UPF0700 family)